MFIYKLYKNIFSMEIKEQNPPKINLKVREEGQLLKVYFNITKKNRSSR